MAAPMSSLRVLERPHETCEARNLRPCCVGHLRVALGSAFRDEQHFAGRRSDSDHCYFVWSPDVKNSDLDYSSSLGNCESVPECFPSEERCRLGV